MGSTSERMAAERLTVETTPSTGTVPAGMVPVEPGVAAMLAEVVRAWAVLDPAGRGRVLHYAPQLGAALARLTPENLSAAARKPETHGDRLLGRDPDAFRVDL